MELKKQILIIDVPDMFDTLASHIYRWGYEPIGTSNQIGDSILEMISRERIDLLIVAKELTLKGPSRSNDWQKGDDINVDFEFGLEVLSRLRLQSNNLPVILLTTDTLRENKWMRNNGNLDWVMMMKCADYGNDVYSNLKRGIEEFLGEGLVPDRRR